MDRLPDICQRIPQICRMRTIFFELFVAEFLQLVQSFEAAIEILFRLQIKAFGVSAKALSKTSGAILPPAIIFARAARSLSVFTWSS